MPFYTTDNSLEAMFGKSILLTVQAISNDFFMDKALNVASTRTNQHTFFVYVHHRANQQGGFRAPLEGCTTLKMAMRTNDPRPV